MRVVLPFTKVIPSVRKAVKATGWKYETVDVSESDCAYMDLVTDLWAAGESFAIVEHDVLVRPDSLDELADCQREWCSFRIPYMYSEYAGLGCVKFTEGLLRRVPNIMTVVWQYSDAKHPAGSWCTMDHALHQALYAADASQCIHGPALGHVRRYKGPQFPTHECWTRPEES